MKKHLVIGSDLFKPSIGGTETVTENMATNLSKTGWRVTVVAPAEKKVKSTPKLVKDPGGYDILRIQSFGLPIQKDLRFSRATYQQVASYFEMPENKPDIVHVNNPFPTSRTLIKFAKSNKLPVVVGGHLMPESFTVGLRRLGNINRPIDGIGWHYIARVYNKADMVVSPTQTGIDYLVEHGLKVPTRVISNGIDLDSNKPLDISNKEREKLKKDKGLSAQYVVLYAGRLGVEKKVDVIITAIAHLQKQFDVKLLLIGDGNARLKLEKLCIKLGIQERVVFTGYVQDVYAKKQLMALSDIFAIASPVELQSIVTLEAMAAGLPVFACKEGALPELAKSGINGGTFVDGDSNGLARLIGGVLHDPIKLREYSKGSLEIIQNHNIKDTWRKYNQMYEDVIADYG